MSWLGPVPTQAAWAACVGLLTLWHAAHALRAPCGRAHPDGLCPRGWHPLAPADIILDACALCAYLLVRVTIDVLALGITLLALSTLEEVTGLAPAGVVVLTLSWSVCVARRLGDRSPELVEQLPPRRP